MLDVNNYKETGTYIMKCGDDTAQQLDDHIVMAQAMSFSPYKKPFEARISTWENKLRTTQVCVFVCESGLVGGICMCLYMGRSRRDLAHIFSSFQIISLSKRHLCPLQLLSYALKISLSIMELQGPEFLIMRTF